MSSGKKYFEGNRFNVKLLVDDICDRRDLVASPLTRSGTGERLFAYRKGAYRSSGESEARSIAVDLLGARVKPSYVNQAIELLYDVTKLDEASLNPAGMDLINFTNGMLDWRKDELLPWSRRYKSTIQLPVSYLPSATSTKLDRFLEALFEEDVRLLVEEVLGYLLIPSTKQQKAFLLKGSGANGKSTFLRIVEALLGRENCSTVPLHDLTTNRFRAAELHSKLLNFFDDIEPMALKNTGKFKAIVGGDPISAERKFGHPFAFRPFARLMFSANELPYTDDKTYAFFRRLIVIPFENTFTEATRDLEISAKLTGPESLSALLNYALAGLRRLEDQGAFTEARSASKALQAYRRRADPVYDFITAYIKVQPHKRVLKRQVYKMYEEWSAKNRLSIVSQRYFNTRLKEITSATKSTLTLSGKRMRAWAGITWRQELTD